jgi:hypothetical protein
LLVKAVPKRTVVVFSGQFYKTFEKVLQRLRVASRAVLDYKSLCLIKMA